MYQIHDKIIDVRFRIGIGVRETTQYYNFEATRRSGDKSDVNAQRWRGSKSAPSTPLTEIWETNRATKPSVWWDLWELRADQRELYIQALK